MFTVYLVELTQHHEKTVSLMKRQFKDLIAIYRVTMVQNDVLLPERIKLLKRMISPANAMQNILRYDYNVTMCCSTFVGRIKLS